MSIMFKLYHWKNFLAGIIIVVAGVSLSQGISYLLKKNADERQESVYLNQIKKDFLRHKKDLIAIDNYNKRMVTLIDSVLNVQPDSKPGTSFFGKIMNTQPYDQTVLAYKNILQDNTITNTDLKLKIATHLAQFEGLAKAKSESIDWQWDKTARPYLYNYGLGMKKNNHENPLADPVFRSVLFDRRMFAHDVVSFTPRMLSSLDSVVSTIDADLKK